METARAAKTIHGDKAYQQFARAALPVLVRQAHAGITMYYSELATELGMRSARNTNYPLGSVGNELERLSKEWGEKIPPIQCLVLSKTTDLPSEGINWFLRDTGEFRGLPLRKRKAIVKGVLASIFAFPRWNEVLAALDLKPTCTGYKPIIDEAAQYRGGGESEEHRALKNFVAEHPQTIGLSRRTGKGEIEFWLPSGDSLDVYFCSKAVRTAVEVKSRISAQADIARGLFQCVKYQAVLEARVAAENSDDSVDAVLVLEGQLPEELRVLKTILGVRVIEKVHPS